MPKVTDTATAGLDVEITLKYADTGVVGIEQTYHTVVDDSGSYEIDLLANDTILPGNSYYELVVDPDGTPSTKQVKVPDSIGGSFDADDILFDPTPALTAAAAAAPAGGTGAAAGGWDTAANRDLAIATINNLRTRLNELETVLKGHGLLN